jgi:uncharacterized protein
MSRPASLVASARRSGLCAIVSALACGIVAAAPAAALDLPALTGRVVDQAGILDQAKQAALTTKLAALEGQTTDQLVVVTLKSLQGTTIEDFGVQLGRAWQIGQKGKNNGVLLIVAPNERKVRIEVGYGLEGTLTDAVSKLIIETAIIPRFRASDFSGGIVRGADDIIQVLSGDAEDFKQRAAAQPAASRSTGFDNGFALIFFIVVLFIVFRAMSGGTRGRRYPGAVVIPGSSASGWSSGGSSSGGGFSGGGGSFGGGGSSGSW